MADASGARGLCALAGPGRTASARALEAAGSAAERHQATAVARAGRELEAMEARLLAMVATQQVQHAADLREADKLAFLASRSVEARMEAMEQRQTQVEQRLVELADAVQGLRCEQEAQDERTAYFAAETRERLEQLWAKRSAGDDPAQAAAATGAIGPSAAAAVGPALPATAPTRGPKQRLEGRLLALESGSGRAEALERRLQALEERRIGPPEAHPVAAQVSTEAAHSHCPGESTALDETAAMTPGDAGCERLAAGDAAFLAVQELESLLRTELKAIRKRCNTLQDQLDERTIVSLKEFEQRLQEEDKMVKQLLCASQESSSRLEEMNSALALHGQNLRFMTRRYPGWRRQGGKEAAPEVVGKLTAAVVVALRPMSPRVHPPLELSQALPLACCQESRPADE
eukprot:CAMPEP_0179117460 /NCGR_PEP_ID=MMETSP0796-20121207/55171_1 /TAXON_ID=73915 /ORGANISM="Pyrodinium bahamense, Strain pbaha01" /LENGTH=403 /DNA_ID=CAMNT_0020815831 /DNA_START=77 /DNA_END=1289 /DNA_ORIENTATION=-